MEREEKEWGWDDTCDEKEEGAENEWYWMESVYYEAQRREYGYDGG